MSYYANDRASMQATFAGLTFAGIIFAILMVFVIMRTSACTVPDTSSHHELLK
ncbi:hypothetical protein BH11MYX3_BH11MYX3_40980 [soil metagenome]